MSRKRVVVAGLGDVGVLAAIRLAKRFDVAGISVKPGLVSGQDLGVRLARPRDWARDYWIPFDRFRRLDPVRIVQGSLTEVDLAARTVSRRGDNGETFVEGYDALIISTGVTNGFWRRPTVQSVAEVGTDLNAAHDRMAAAKSVIVVGGGAAAVTSAVNLATTWPDKRIDLYFPGHRTAGGFGRRRALGDRAGAAQHRLAAARTAGREGLRPRDTGASGAGAPKCVRGRQCRGQRPAAQLRPQPRGRAGGPQRPRRTCRQTLPHVSSARAPLGLGTGHPAQWLGGLPTDRTGVSPAVMAGRAPGHAGSRAAGHVRRRARKPPGGLTTARSAALAAHPLKRADALDAHAGEAVVFQDVADFVFPENVRPAGGKGPPQIDLWTQGR